MFIGHFAIALAAKKAAPKVSLGLLFLSAQFLDLLWPTLLLLGIESVQIEPGITAFTPLNFTSYPYSHSLIMVTAWAVLIGGFYYLVTTQGRAATIIAICVASHWFLDLVMHRPDLPLLPNDQVKVGLGLWGSVPATLTVELLLFAAGLFVYLKTTRANNRTGIYSFWTLIVFLIIIYLANAFGPPPPSVEAIGWAGQLQWLIVLWAWWADRHREVIPRRAS